MIEIGKIFGEFALWAETVDKMANAQIVFTDDFTLEYVAAHSNSQLPTFFKVAATWGGHEGSILFWLFTLSLWLVAFAFFSRKNDRTFSLKELIWQIG